MDPLSHLVCGGALVTLVQGRRSRPGMLIAATLGAVAPDVDALLMPAGWDIYLRAHEIGTHSVLGSIATACAAAAIVRAFTHGSRYWTLLAGASIGTLSHLALDLLSGGRLRAGWPLLDGRISVPLVAMADPWLAAIFSAGAVALWIGRRQPRSAALFTMATAAAFLAVKGAGLEHALATWKAGPGLEHVADRVVEARWGSLNQWYVYDRTPGALRQWLLDARGDAPRLLLSWPITVEPPLVSRSRSLTTVRNFLHVHDLGFAVQQEEGSETRVLWSDLRYCRPGVTTSLPFGTPGRNQIACDLWFGGGFSAGGNPLNEIVQVGGWLQRRPVGQ
jgi:membrane-bound metal-dependent hydrolase YbcI (DUF457 family)